MEEIPQEAEDEVNEEETQPIDAETFAPALVGTTWQWIRFGDMGEINNLDEDRKELLDMVETAEWLAN